MFFFILLSCSSKSPSITPVQQIDQVQKAQLVAHVQELASDAYLGRGTLEPGLDKAAEYISNKYAEFGLTPIDGQEEFLVPYTLYQGGWAAEQSLSLSYDDNTLALSEAQWIPFPFSDSGSVSADLVFAGYGITAPEHNWDDYKDLDVQDKIVLVLRREPGANDPESPFNGTESSEHSYFRSKAENAIKHGAKGMLLFTDPTHPNPNDDFRRKGQLFVDPPDLNAQQQGPLFLAAQVSPKTIQPLFKQQSLTDIQTLLDSGTPPAEIAFSTTSANLSWTRKEEASSVVVNNVVGMIEGTDPELGKELLVIGAHFDHLGYFEGEGDTIYNGADDNASGTAALLELARLHASGTPPKRSIVFAAFSAEELGLLGSRAFIRQIDPKQVSLMLNFDMIGRNSNAPIEIIGDGYAVGMSEAIMKANQDIGLNIELAGDNYFGASDHDPFFKANRPFLFFFTGTHEDYHQLSDHIEKLDFEQMHKITSLGSKVISSVANNDYTPQFISHLSWLGITLSTHTDSASILNVAQDSRAVDAELQQDDVIEAINKESSPPQEIAQMLTELPPGDIVSLTINRNGDTFEREITRAKTGYVGIYPGAVPSEMRTTLAIPDTQGVLIRQLLEDGPAGQSGFLAEDIILQIDGRSVTPRNLSAVLQRIGAGEQVVCLVLRDGERLKLELTLGERPSR